MFSALRNNSVLYVLEKTNMPILKMANVINVSAPVQKFNAYNPLNPETSIDINVKFEDGTSMDIKQLPSNLSVANFGNTIVAETKELMASEVETMLRNSKGIIESVPYHEKVIDACESMLVKLNPDIAEKKQTEERLNKIEDMLAKLLSQSSK